MIIITDYHGSAHVYGRGCVCVCVLCFCIRCVTLCSGDSYSTPLAESLLPSTMVVNAPRPSMENKINCTLCRSRPSFLSAV